ncbi:hypothetical protein GF351_05580 [Candidatus Woesearchaeota archaeon]|nr:hypothetical protein [Candidatus Woesearchaeota archaeon]
MKQVTKLLLRKGAVFLAYLILLGIGNLIPVQDQYYSMIIGFLNTNTIWIFLFALFFASAEALKMTKVPYIIGYPIANAFGTFFLIRFMFSLAYLIDETFGLKFLFSGYETTTYAVVIIAVLAMGYFKVWRQSAGKKEDR